MTQQARPRPREVVVAIDDGDLRAAVVAIARACGLEVCQVDDPRRLAHSPEMERLVVASTGQDVALLNQIVYARHLVDRPKRGIPFIAIVPVDALERNWSLGAWVIDNAAAITAVLAQDEQCLTGIRNLLLRMTGGV